MSLPVIRGKWSWPAAWSWGSGDHRARMRRERNTAGTRNCAESRAGSLRAMPGAAAAHCGVGGGHTTPGTSGQPRGYRPFTRIRTGRGPVCWKQEDHAIVLIPWGPLVLSAGNASEALVPEYFQGLPVKVKGSRPLGLAWPLQPGSPTPHPCPCLFAPLLTNICSAVVHKPGLAVTVACRQCMPTGHTQPRTKWPRLPVCWTVPFLWSL